MLPVLPIIPASMSVSDGVVDDEGKSFYKKVTISSMKNTRPVHEFYSFCGFYHLKLFKRKTAPMNFDL